MSNKKLSTAIDDEEEKAVNLYNALVNEKSVFYATDKITETLMNKARNSLYEQDIVFVNISNGLENKKYLPEKVPLNTKFVEKKQVIIPITLYSFSRPFEVLQADIASISFLGRSAVDPKFCVLFVDLSTSKMYTYPRKKNLLAKKVKLFYKDIEKKGWAK